MSEPQTYKNLIGGEWVASVTGQTFESTNPADTREVVGVFQQSNAEDVDAAVQAAKRAYESWRLTPAPKRGEILFKAAAEETRPRSRRRTSRRAQRAGRPRYDP
ncbi:MAG TPA: aldehyde dehydrogenase family protein [Herpetosiphonaceae bacterium]